MNAVGIDVSKGKSTVAILRPFGEIVASPFEVAHTNSELSELAGKLKSLDGETKIVMESTGNYHLPIAHALHAAGLTVSVNHAQLIRDFGNNTIRKGKTDKMDSLKIANYGLTHWLDLPEYIPEDELRQMLKAFNRQYNKYTKIKITLKNNLISLLDQTFPGVNELFTSPPRKSDGHEKWIDFVSRFWHCKCISSHSQKVFKEQYRKWCKRSGYNFSESKAEELYLEALKHYNVMSKNDTTKLLITQAIMQIGTIAESLAVVSREMQRLASMLPEYPVIISFRGVGEILCPQLIAEIGDIHRFNRKESLVCYAGLDVPPNQSGKFESHNMGISKKGSPHLRKALFQVMDCLLKHSPSDDNVYQFLDRKRAEGKHYYCYMTAGSAKFLRVYYARVKEYLNSLNVNS